MGGENGAVFKSFLRLQLRLLLELQKALNSNDIELAKTIVNQLIDDIQKGIED